MPKIGTTKYYEAYAKISLIDIYKKDLTSSKTINKESPDIQDDINDIGIEVTRSATNAECIADSITNNVFHKNHNLDELKNEITKKYKSFNGEVGRIQNCNYISPHIGLVNTSIFYERIKDRIIEKSKLFYDHYKKYSENDLYIFTGNSLLNIEDIQKIIDELKDFKIPFNNIFINCLDKIFICNKNNVIQKDITEDKMKYYKSEAINYKE